MAVTSENPASTSSTETTPLINDNPELQSYYQSWESRIGYRLVLGGTRHFGYWDKDTWWPFPVTAALRRMEQQLFEKLAVPKGGAVLDAGCGIAHVALAMARNGLKVTGIDVIDRHIDRAQRNIKASGLPKGQVTALKADYHNLNFIPAESLDGIYTMETLVHATDLRRVLEGFYRILKPGGRYAGHEYETINVTTAKDAGSLADDVLAISIQSAMPLDLMKEGYLKQTLEDVGFVDVQIQDLSDNVRPMLRLFFWLAIIPYLLMKMLHVDKYFTNTVAGAGGLPGQKYWRYIAVQASKPGGPLESEKTK